MGGLMDVTEGIFGKEGSPTTPDYSYAAKQGFDSSAQAAIINALMNRPNETTPYGSRTWNQTGTQMIPGIGGQPGFEIPTYSSSVNFTPEGQKLFDLSNQMKQSQGELGVNVSGQARDALSGGLDLSGAPKMYSEADLQGNRDAVTKAMFDRSMRLQQPLMDLERKRTEGNLINRGFSMGNEGYTGEMDRLNLRQDRQVQDAADAALLAGGQEQSRLFGMSQADRQQAINEALLKRSLPLSELNTLMTGSAPSLPNFQPYSATSNVQGANFLGATDAEQKARLAKYGLESERSNMIHKGIMDIWGGAMGQF